MLMEGLHSGVDRGGLIGRPPETFDDTRISTPTTSSMAFAIEVSGEAAPLSPQQIFLALQSAGSSQQLSIQTGTQQLQTWETHRGYYPLLQVCHIISPLDLPPLTMYIGSIS